MDAKKARLIKNVIQAIVVVTVGYVVRAKTAETHALLWIAAGWLLTAWVVLKLAMALKRGYKNVRAHTATGLNLENLDKLTVASMRPWQRGGYAMEKMVYRGFWRTITRKPLVPAGEFSVAGGRNGKLLAVGMMLLAVACAAAVALYLPGVAMRFWPRLLAYAGAGLAVLYTAIWALGALRSLKEGGLRIAHDALFIDLGIVCSGAVALSDIAACSVLSDPAQRDATGDVWTASPAEQANVLIELNGPTTLEITRFGAPREVTRRFIALYLDQPGAFVDALSRASAGAERSAAA